MLRSRPFVTGLLALALAVGLATRAGANCGAEGCPLVARGLDSGRFGFDFRYETVTQDKLWDGSHEITLDEANSDAGLLHEIELFTRTRTWVGSAHFAVTPTLFVSGTLPYMQREHRHQIQHHAGLFYDYDWNYQGLGDATVLAQWTALHREGWPRVSLQGGAKLPTGERHTELVLDEEPEPSARLGTGSTDALFGVALSQSLPSSKALPLQLNVLVRRNGKGTDDYRVGNEVQAGISTGWALAPWATLLGQVNFADHGSDVASDPEEEAAHTGGRAVFVTPGVSVKLAPGLNMYGIYQGRVWGHTDEATIVAPNHFLIGTSYTLGR